VSPHDANSGSRVAGAATDDPENANRSLGAALPCPSCGEPVAASGRFCEACGHELPAAEGALASAAATAADVSATATATCPGCGADEQPAGGWCASCGLRVPSPRDHAERLDGPMAAVTDKGLRHHRNEDAFAVTVEPGAVRAVVCDGVSSTVRPDDASLAAAEAALARLVADDAHAPDFVAAHAAALAAVQAVPFEPRPDLGPPSCTFLAATVTDTLVSLASLGDCRAYWVDALGDARQLTVDDSWAMEEVRAGRRSEAEALEHPMGHTITRWLAADADPVWVPTMTDFEPAGPGRVVLCSDGLWNYLATPADLAAAVAAAGPGAAGLDLARHLTTLALDGGGHDNITVVVVDLPLGEPTVPPAPTVPPESPSPTPAGDPADP